MHDPHRTVLQGLLQKHLHVIGVDPGRPEAGVDVTGSEVIRDHLGQRRHVLREPRVIHRRGVRRREAGANVTGEVFRGGQQPPGNRVVKHQATQPLPGGVGTGPQQPGHFR